MRRLGAVAAVVAAALTMALSACDQPHNELGTTSSACFRAVAPARAAVHGTGTLLGVRKANLDRLRTHLSGVQHEQSTVCLVAYRGKYGPGSVDHQAGSSSGSYAVVAVKLRPDTVLSTFVTDRLPARFRHL